MDRWHESKEKLVGHTLSLAEACPLMCYKKRNAPLLVDDSPTAEAQGEVLDDADGGRLLSVSSQRVPMWTLSATGT